MRCRREDGRALQQFLSLPTLHPSIAMLTEPRSEYGALKLLVGGVWVESRSDDLRNSYNPAKGQVIAKIPFALPEEVKGAVASAQDAFDAWKNVSILERAKYLFKMKEVLEKSLSLKMWFQRAVTVILPQLMPKVFP